MTRFLVVDDHVAIRQGLERILAATFTDAEIHSAGTPAEVLEKVAANGFELIVLDLSLPGRGGLDLIKQIKDLNPTAKILIYTVHPDEQLGVRCLRAGADGYVTKDRPIEELIEAIQRIIQGRKYISPHLAEILAQSVASGSKGASLDALSDRELQVLRMLASGKGATDIAETLHLSIKTVSTYRARLLEKLNLETTADLIRFALEQGLV